MKKRQFIKVAILVAVPATVVVCLLPALAVCMVLDRG